MLRDLVACDTCGTTTEVLIVDGRESVGKALGAIAECSR
jgi:hypothetical protein